MGALLDQLAGAEHKDGVVVDDRREPVGNRAQRDAVKLRPQERLHARVGGPYCTASNREYSIPPTGMCVLKRRSPTRLCNLCTALLFTALTSQLYNYTVQLYCNPARAYCILQTDSVTLYTVQLYTVQHGTASQFSKIYLISICDQSV